MTLNIHFWALTGARQCANGLATLDIGLLSLIGFGNVLIFNILCLNAHFIHTKSRCESCEFILRKSGRPRTRARQSSWNALFFA